MAQAYNKSQVKLIIDGDEVVELADSEDAVLCPDSMPALTATRGATGRADGRGYRRPRRPDQRLPCCLFQQPTTRQTMLHGRSGDDLLQQARDGEALEPIQGTLEVPDRYLRTGQRVLRRRTDGSNLR